MKLILQRLAARPLLNFYFLLLALAFLYRDLFVAPSVPSINTAGDQAVSLLNAMRMLQGQMIYRDFFQFTTPGTELVYLALFRLCGVCAWIPNAMLVVLGFGFTWLSIVISRRLVGGLTAYLPGLLFLVMAFHTNPDASHHWYSILAVMAAVAVVIEKRTPARIAGAAALCGLAAFFTQIHGVFALLGVSGFLLWEQCQKGKNRRSLLRDEACLWGVFLATIVALNAYFAWKAGLGRFLGCTVVFGLKYYRADVRWNSLRVYMSDLPDFLPWDRLPYLGTYLLIHGLLPLVYLLFLAGYRREAGRRPNEPWDRLMLLSIVGLSLFVGIAPAPGSNRLCAVSLPALMVFVWFLGSPGRLAQSVRRLLWVGVVVLMVGTAWHRQNEWKVYLDAPSGRVAFFDPAAHERYQWLLDRTRPSEFLFDASLADIYFPLLLRSPAKVPFVTATDYTRPAQVRDVVEALENRRVRLVLWEFDLDSGAGGPPSGDHLSPLRAYLRTHYHVVGTFPNLDQVWERNSERIGETPQKACVR